MASSDEVATKLNSRPYLELVFGLFVLGCHRNMVDTVEEDLQPLKIQKFHSKVMKTLHILILGQF